jgi:fused signal recognition particle receptor
VQKFKIPVYAIGVGEHLDDLNEFNPEDFAKGLLGL